MTRATYNTDNTITELPDLEPPPDKPIENNYWGNRAAFYRDMINWQRVMDDYNANALKIAAVCRTIPCSPECRGLWKEGQVLEEGKDYEVKGAGEWKWASQLKGNVFAAPVPPPPASAEDEAARMYPYVDIANSKELTDLQRSAHITCAGMYTDTIDKLKAEVEHWKDEFESAVLELREFKNKHNL